MTSLYNVTKFWDDPVITNSVKHDFRYVWTLIWLGKYSTGEIIPYVFSMRSPNFPFKPLKKKRSSSPFSQLIFSYALWIRISNVFGRIFRLHMKIYLLGIDERGIICASLKWSISGIFMKTFRTLVLAYNIQFRRIWLILWLFLIMIKCLNLNWH